MPPESRPKTCAIIGNPNSGKSSLFNQLTGLRQDVSNFPGVTVDKKTAIIHLAETTLVRLIDFPGSYSLFPNSIEERIVVESLCQPKGPFVPDLVVYVVDVTQLERHLLLATQIIDLGYPLIFVVNMMDILEEEGASLSIKELEQFLQVPIVPVSVRKHTGLDTLRLAIYGALYDVPKPRKQIYTLDKTELDIATKVAQTLGIDNLYQAKLIAHHHSWLGFLDQEHKLEIENFVKESSFVDLKYQVQETMTRFDSIVPTVKKSITNNNITNQVTTTDKIDNIVTHRFWGPAIFFSIMLLVFQAIFTWASLPMDLIESGFASAGTWFRSWLPTSWMTDLFVEGIWAGLGGVLVFVPQIAILFFLVAILEESGYMSRAVYMFDNIMRKFGLNGRSMVALISSAACAIPAIMSTRTISNQKERLLTILVSPLISCSARLPVYAVLIGFAVPQFRVGGIFNSQGLAFMGLYLLGIIGALLSALLLKPFVKDVSGSYLMMELPNYKAPMWQNIGLTVIEKVKSFIVDAGKIILLISIILWALASYGPEKAMQQVEQNAAVLVQSQLGIDAEKALATAKLEASYIGHIGKAIEPAIAPLGFDWKIGIAIITSFAAREVFVGTMATIYSVGDTDGNLPLRQRMAAEKRLDGSMVYTVATALSLLVFYVFAMQCMSTLAVTKRETHSWKWPIVQFVFMSVLAYLSSFIVYQLMA
jgi:ferrous iron transport protein B